jgi:Zn-dependent M16 (insulinase) family peptidase
MSPDEKFVTERESILSDLESNLVSNLSDSDREKISEIEKKLLEEQSTKENDESIACLPTLQMADIPLEKPIYKVLYLKHFHIEQSHNKILKCLKYLSF